MTIFEEFVLNSSVSFVPAAALEGFESWRVARCFPEVDIPYMPTQLNSKASLGGHSTRPHEWTTPTNGGPSRSSKAQMNAVASFVTSPPLAAESVRRGDSSLHVRRAHTDVARKRPEDNVAKCEAAQSPLPRVRHLSGALYASNRFTLKGVTISSVPRSSWWLERHGGVCFGRQWLTWLTLVLLTLKLFILWGFSEAPSHNGVLAAPALGPSADADTMFADNSWQALFARSLHGDAASFVASRVRAVLGGGASLSEAPRAAAEAALSISWGECSKLCGGGTQRADKDKARTLAMEGIRLALKDRDDFSEGDVLAAGDLAFELALDAASADAAAVKTRSCNTFSCPPMMPTDLEAARLQVARDPAELAGFGVLPQVDFSEQCKERLQVKTIEQADWVKLRNQHSARLQQQQANGEEAGWEAVVLASPELSLYECVSLCRMYRPCTAVVYSEAAQPVKNTFKAQAAARQEDEGEGSTDLDGTSGTEGLGVPLGLAEAALKSSRKPVCTLYERTKVSLVRECGVEPQNSDGSVSSTLLVLNPNVNFAEAARLLRMTMALQRDKKLASAKAASRTTSKHASDSEALPSANDGDYERRIMESLSPKALRYLQSLSHAVRVTEGAALRAVEVLRAAASMGVSVPPVTLAARLAVGQGVSEASSLRDLYSFKATHPVSESCQLFFGVELLGRGCVELPALRTVQALGNAEASSAQAGGDKDTPSREVSSVGWQRCPGVLRESERLLKEYRDALVQVQEATEDGKEAALAEAKRLMAAVLDLDSAEAAQLEDSSDIIGRAESYTVLEKDKQAFLDKLEALRLRRGVLEELGKGEGSLIAIFDAAEGVCEIRAVFEPRVQRGSASLGEQFPSGCAMFKPFAVLLLPFEEESPVDGQAAGKSSEQAAGSQTDGVCPKLSCVYSPWTSWSPCEDHSEAAQGDGESPVEEEGLEVLQASQLKPRARATWQVRFKEALVQPPGAPRCEAPVEARRCGASEAAAGSETSSQVDAFTSSVAHKTTTWCEYSPYSEWTHCEPSCLPPHVQGAHSYRTRTRFVQQFPVPGLAPSCDHESLEVKKQCSKVRQCEHSGEGAEAGGIDKPFASTGHTSAASISTVASSDGVSDIHLLPSSGEKFVEAKRHFSDRAGLAYSSSVDSQLISDGEIVPSFNRIDDAAEEIGGGIADQDRRHHDIASDWAGSTFAFSRSDDAQNGRAVAEDAPSWLDGQLLPFERVDSSGPEELTWGGRGSSSSEADSFSHSPYGAAGAPDKNSGYHTAVPRPPAAGEEEGPGSKEEALSTLPFDTPASDNPPLTKEKGDEAAAADSAGGGQPSITQTDADGEISDSVLGLSLGSFVTCCLCGAFACATLVLLLVVCSSGVRSWLGHDWSGATEAERKELLKGEGGLGSSSIVAPLVDPTGVRVLGADGAPLIVSPCMDEAGTQYQTSQASKIFVTMSGDFVDNWGKPVPTNDLPAELEAKVEPSPEKAGLPAHVTLQLPLPGAPFRVAGLPSLAAPSGSATEAGGPAGASVGAIAPPKAPAGASPVLEGKATSPGALGAKLSTPAGPKAKAMAKPRSKAPAVRSLSPSAKASGL
ncbi:hypothetical protein ACSSS7_001561 [Eimeria intestinalis]